MKLMFACLCPIVLLAACNDSQGALTAPSSVEGPGQPPASSQPSALTHRLSGVVTAAGVPASGAEVAELQTVYGDDCFTPDELSGTASDASGSYTLPAVRDSSQLDFTLDPWVHISLGDVVRGIVQAGDAFCYGNSYGVPGLCHRFALTVRSAGTLEVTLTWPSIRPDVVLDVVRPGGIPCAAFSWPGGSRHHLRIPADAGSTYEIRVVDDGSASPLNYELATVLR